MQRALAEKIAGEITLSDSPGKTLRKWRTELRISQKDLSKHLGISPSVVSDYESGRRKSPGIRTIRKIVETLVEIDESSGRELSKRYATLSNDAIPSIGEFPVSIRASDFIRKIEGKVLTSNLSLKREVNGYTVIDSLKAITTLNSFDFLRIYGHSSERALIFTGVKYGRSPMVAIRAHPLKPAMVVYVRPERIDELAIKLAELERILLVRTDLEVSELIKRLERL